MVKLVVHCHFSFLSLGSNPRLTSSIENTQESLLSRGCISNASTTRVVESLELLVDEFFLCYCVILHVREFCLWQGWGFIVTAFCCLSFVKLSVGVTCELGSYECSDMISKYLGRPSNRKSPWYLEFLRNLGHWNHYTRKAIVLFSLTILFFSEIFKLSVLLSM